METSHVDPLELMLIVIQEKTSTANKWAGQPLGAFRLVENTNRGDIGEEFVHRYLRHYGLPVSGHGSRISRADMELYGKLFEIKTASEDKGGGFQFNHIRLDRRYDYLLCLAVRPREIMFNVWTKGQVSEEKAGRLVRMAEGQSVTFKLTKRPEHLLPIQELPGWARGLE